MTSESSDVMRMGMGRRMLRMRAMEVELPQGQGVVVGPVGEAAVVVVLLGDDSIETILA